MISRSSGGRVSPGDLRRDAFAERIFAGEERAGERFVDDRHAGGGVRVSRVEVPPALQRNAQRAEKARRDGAGVAQRPVGGRSRPAGDEHGRLPVVGTHRQRINRADRPYPGQCGDALQRGPVEVAIARRLPRIPGFGQCQPDCENALRIEARRHVLELPERADEQPGADEQNKGERQFCDHQRAAQTPPARAAARAAPSTFAKTRGWISPRHAPGRREAERHAGEQADERGEREHARVGSNVAGAREIFRQQCDDSRGAPEREQQPGRAPEQREHDALGQQLSHDPPSPRAQGRADADFPLPRRGASEQQIGDVHASDEQHAARRAEQDQQRRPHFGRQVAEDRQRFRKLIPVRVRILPS